MTASGSFGPAGMGTRRGHEVDQAVVRALGVELGRDAIARLEPYLCRAS